MNGWRGSWAAARITGVIFSSLVWIVVWGLSLPTLLVTMAVGLVLVIGRNTRPMLGWRFGGAPANDYQRDTMLTAVVPIASLRGRHQPSIWIGRRLFGAEIVMPSRILLVVSPEFVGRVARGQLTDRQASAIISHALGTVEVANSTLVNVVEVFCLPWRFVQVLVAAVSRLADHHRTFRFCWKVRWIVFAVATIDNSLNSRWAALVGVILIAGLSWTTSFFQNRWDHRCQNLGDQCAIAAGLGADLADLVHRGDGPLSTSGRVNGLRRGNPGETIGAGDRTASMRTPGPARGRPQLRPRQGLRAPIGTSASVKLRER